MFGVSGLHGDKLRLMEETFPNVGPNEPPRILLAADPSGTPAGALGGERRRARVRLLDGHTVNQIAAGEVVERPASVVKELVENALDAEATRVRVRVEDAGRTLIEVADNGYGMSAEDALAALQRHATSKIERVEDLQRATSLGFRGEAIPSIASVSRFCMTSAEEDGSRCVVLVEGGEVSPLGFEAGPRGTTILVEDLFFNTPARLKFQKSASTEMGLISEWIGKYALAFPHVSFRLTHGANVLIESPGDGDMEGALAAVWGRETARALVPFQSLREGIRVRGWVSPPHLTRPTRSQQWIFVNGRPIRNRALYSALDAAFRQLTPDRRYPICALLIDMDPARVDMNVSPTKSEARFQNERLLFDAVRTGVRDGLLAHGMLPSAEGLARANEALGAAFGGGDSYSGARGGGFAGAFSGFSDAQPRLSATGFGASPSMRMAEEVAADPAAYAGRSSEAGHSGDAAPDRFERMAGPVDRADLAAFGGFGAPELADGTAGGSAALGRGAGLDAFSELGYIGYAGQRHIDPLSGDAASDDSVSHPSLGAVAGPRTGSELEPFAGPEIGSEAYLSQDRAAPNADLGAGAVSLQAARRLLEGLRILGQTSDAFFILAENRDGLLIIDQHVAHERILFEKLRASRGQGTLERQPLLTPLSLELDRRSIAVAMEHLEALDEAGFAVEPFGPSTLLVRSTPAALRRDDPLMVLRDLIDDLAQGTHGSRLSPRENVWVMCSCKMAIKAGERLSPVEMEKLVLDLATTENPFLCPHGRPITLVLSRQDLLRKFKRA